MHRARTQHAARDAGPGRRREKLERQWARYVAHAATLPYAEESVHRTETTAETVALVEQLRRATDACPLLGHH
ncbi:hypothetical protein ACFW6E_39395 [Streptomyces olivaceoviridis]|uniref:hypothetical protein n=1 Tax=Streptomyces olivaceoviridis TaxID=1921 RepID=UPI0036BCF10F